MRRLRSKWTVSAILACLATRAGLACGQSLVIHPPDYKPPETTQRVPIPLPPQNGRLRLLIISGDNSYEHDWTGVNNMLRMELEQTGRFDVRVTEEFHGATPATLKGYDVLLLNYLGRWNYTDAAEDRWDPGAQKALFDYVRNGGGIVIYHASCSMGAPSWPEFERLSGGKMRPNESSRRSPPLGFMVHVKVKLMPGMDQDHPMVWTVEYGKGHVFAITLGHGPDTLQYAGVRGLIARGAEWAATTKVTIPVEDGAQAFAIN